MDYRMLTKSDPFPLSFTDSILETIASREIYSLMDGLNGYN